MHTVHLLDVLRDVTRNADEVVAMTSHCGNLYVATKYGRIYVIKEGF